MKIAHWYCPRLSLLLLFMWLTACSKAPHETTQKQQNVIEYARQCAALIGAVPAFNCNDGVDVPITVNNQIPDEYHAGMTCDRPAMLPYGEQTFGQCTPYSKVQDLSYDNVQISAFCRREYLRSPDSPFYDEVDIILHSVDSGDTCWFHAARAQGDSQGFDASRVPPPDEESPPSGHVSALAFWWSPKDTAAMQCGSCHDADPFMYSPYIGQVWQHVPVDPNGWYNNHIGEAFQDWPVSHSITTPDNTCVGCHRIGSLDTCSQDLLASTAGMKPMTGGNQLANSYPLSHWMPAHNFHSEAFWNNAYQSSVAALISCCNDPSLPMCNIQPITGKP